jgi:hypothetical protein
VTARRALVAAVVVITASWLVLLLIWQDAPFALTFDDAYYYFGIARNVAEGHGSTFDRINSTNGYHPLWLAIAVPFFAAGLDGMAAVRVLLAVQMLVYGAAFLLVADSVGHAVGTWRAVRERRGAGTSTGWCTAVVVAVFALLVGNPFVVKVFVNGLESAVVLAVDALLLWVVARGLPAAGPRWCDDRSSRWRLGVGMLLALAFLARTDAVILVGCLGAWVLFESWPPSGTRVRAWAELFGPVAVTAAVYLVANYVAFGTPVQVSGLVKQAHLDAGRLLAALAVAALAALVFVVTFRNHRAASTATRLPLVLAFLRRTGWFGAFTVLLIGYYSVLQTQQWLWYYAPAVLYAVWLLTLLTADFVSSSLVEADPSRSLGRALGPVGALLLVPFAIAAVLQTRVFADPDLRSIQTANRDAGEWIAASLPDDAVLASWDAGVVGYFSQRRVVNLDGVVNSLEWHRATQRGETANFLEREGLGWIVNHGEDVEGRDPAIDAFIRTQFGPDVLAGSSIERSWPFVFSGITTGSAGTGAPGDQPQAVFLYRLPPL